MLGIIKKGYGTAEYSEIVRVVSMTTSYFEALKYAQCVPVANEPFPRFFPLPAVVGHNITKYRESTLLLDFWERNYQTERSKLGPSLPNFTFQSKLSLGCKDYSPRRN